MKKSIIALFAAAAMSAGVNAQSDNDGANSGNGLNAVSGGTIATAAVSMAVLSAMVSNNRKEGEVDDVDNGGGNGGTDPECSGDDPLQNDFCVGTTTTVTSTVTVSGTGTATQTVTVPITVPVTFTYAPQ